MMDPEANLNEQRKIAEQILGFEGIPEGVDVHDLLARIRDLLLSSVRLSELVLSLDEWIKARGAKPKDWDKHSI